MPNVTVDPSRQTCNPDPAPADHGQATIFTFTLVNPNLWDWVAPSPIAVTSGGGQFPAASYIDSRTNKAVLFDKNTDAAPTQYKYTVSVTNKNTGAPVTLDPFIQNQ